MELPAGFRDMMQGLLGSEAGAFFEAMGQRPAVSVRLNSRKPSDAFPEGEPVSWCACALYLKERPSFTLDPLLHAGAYYVQDASSSVIWETTKRIAAALAAAAGTGTPPPVSAIDLCAAPGGKATAIIDALPGGSRLTANEYVQKRCAALRENITKWGVPGVSVTNLPVEAFAMRGDTYDFVNVDAPCSGEGMMRKDPDAAAQWSMELIRDCAQLQRKILEDAAKLVKPGGFLVYSTCTFNTVENEANAMYIAGELGLEPFDLSFPAEWGIPRGIDTDLPVYRFMPHKTRGEGLFLSVFRKPGVWEPPHIKEIVSNPSRAIIPQSSGFLNKGIRKDTGRKDGKGLPADRHGEEVPAIGEILSTQFDKTKWPVADLSLDQARSYLRRESLVLEPGIPKGVVIVTYKGHPLGPVKNIGTRANNLYPKEWRILMR